MYLLPSVQQILHYFHFTSFNISIQNNSTHASGCAVGNVSITDCATSILFTLQYIVVSVVIAGSTVAA
jgi:hypothetical protein